MIGMSPDAASLVADKTVIQVAIYIKHSISTLNESGFVYNTMEVISGRATHAYHTQET